MKFTELSPEAQEKAIDVFRDELYDGKHYSQDLPKWAVDDCSLFEPLDAEMTQMFGTDYVSRNRGNYMLANDRTNIYFNTDAPYKHLECHEAIRVTDDEMFFKWLGLGRKHMEKINYSLESDGSRYPDTELILEVNDPDDEITKEELDEIGIRFEAAQKKFKDHLFEVLERIGSTIESAYEDAYIREWLENNVKGPEFIESGLLEECVESD